MIARTRAMFLLAGLATVALTVFAASCASESPTTPSTVTVAGPLPPTASPGRVSLTATPESVPFGGGSSTVTAVVTDASSNPLRFAPVAFSTSSGSITPANAKTDSNGKVQTTLTTTSAAVVTAVAGAAPADTGAPSGPTVTNSLTIPMTGRPVPVVSIAANGPALAGAAATFTVAVTPAAGSGTTIRNVSVSFGDGSTTDLGTATGTDIAVQHVYANGGTYSVSVTATDSGGGAAAASTSVAVGAAAALSVAIAAGPMIPAGGGPKAIVTFAASVFPPTAVISSYVWDFGDGGGPQQTTSKQLQHVFANPGLYTVTVTVTEAVSGRTATNSVPVSTASGTPVVSIAASENPVAGRTTTFKMSAIVAAGSSVSMQSVKVAFGDGTTVDLGPVSGDAITASHIYASAGTYLASVTATDSAGGAGTASTQVVVAAPGAPSVTVS